MTQKEIEGAGRSPWRAENRDWGLTLRIQGAPSNLGHELARTTIANILEAQRNRGLAPERARKRTLKELPGSCTAGTDRRSGLLYLLGVWTVKRTPSLHGPVLLSKAFFSTPFQIAGIISCNQPTRVKD